MVACGRGNTVINKNLCMYVILLLLHLKALQLVYLEHKSMTFIFGCLVISERSMLVIYLFTCAVTYEQLSCLCRKGPCTVFPYIHLMALLFQMPGCAFYNQYSLSHSFGAILYRVEGQLLNGIHILFITFAYFMF